MPESEDTLCRRIAEAALQVRQLELSYNIASETYQDAWPASAPNRFSLRANKQMVGDGFTRVIREFELAVDALEQLRETRHA